MIRHSVNVSNVKRFGITSPHYLNRQVGYRGGIRK
ncbi:hypothetical protein [Microvirus mar34]|uniref:Uncharacterized protein n=1 Tax=Microvirus mar34 TaxID=2851168 RepID=A0A8F5MKA3_9VIRU|nr:hypothetical protein [Microvirus mar34]